MSQKCEASLGLQIIIEDSSRNMHGWPNPYINYILGENASMKQKLVKWNSECQEAFHKLQRIVYHYTHPGIC